MAGLPIIDGARGSAGALPVSRLNATICGIRQYMKD